MSDPTNTVDPAPAPAAAATDAPAPASVAVATVSAGVPVDLGDKPSTVTIKAVAQGNPDDDCKTVEVEYPDGSTEHHQVFHKQDDAVQQLWSKITNHFKLHFKRDVAAPASLPATTVDAHVGSTSTLEAVK